MTKRKTENMRKCFSLLRQFIHQTSAEDDKNGTAVLVLNHLEKITAGKDLQVPGTNAPIGKEGKGTGTDLRILIWRRFLSA